MKNHLKNSRKNVFVVKESLEQSVQTVAEKCQINNILLHKKSTCYIAIASALSFLLIIPRCIFFERRSWWGGRGEPYGRRNRHTIRCKEPLQQVTRVIYGLPLQHPDHKEPLHELP